jgi:hypothetical protein
MADPTPRRFFNSDLVADTARGLFALGGIGLVGYGAWLHYEPLGFIAGGLLLLVVGVAATLRAR